MPNDEKPRLAGNFFERVKTILEKENIKYDVKVVAELINKYFPDWRRVLNELQRYSASGKIDAGILVNISEVNINELMQALKAQECKGVRRWIGRNLDNDRTRICRLLDDNLYDNGDAPTIPHAVSSLA